MTQASALGLISADAHANEPRDLWSRNLPRAMRDQAMRGLQEKDDGGWEVILDQGHMGRSDESEEQRLAVNDARNRFAVMRDEGTIGECVFPTIGLYVWMLKDPEGGKYSCRIYNEWIGEQLQSVSQRFCCAGLIPTWRLEDAVEEVANVAASGLRAVMLPTVPSNVLTKQGAVSWPNWNHPSWEPLWEAIEDTGLPIVMHQGTGHDMIWYRGPGATIANVIATQSMAPRTATLLATSGTLARHPALHFVFVEYNAGWLGWAMETVDNYNVAFSTLPTLESGRDRLYPELEESPSFYMRRQIHATFQDDHTCIRNIEQSGTDSLMWGNDYPHPEGTYPKSREIVDRLAVPLDQTARRKIFRDNAATVFGFDDEVLATPVPG
jgi:predicted TIM-barrel fold metal-dependent hydrolase